MQKWDRLAFRQATTGIMRVAKLTRTDEV